jgi:hypothetical protein
VAFPTESQPDDPTTGPAFVVKLMACENAMPHASKRDFRMKFSINTIVPFMIFLAFAAICFGLFYAGAREKRVGHSIEASVAQRIVPNTEVRYSGGGGTDPGLTGPTATLYKFPQKAITKS